jgi:hypothetical protein
VDSLAPASVRLARMSLNELISSINAETARLQKARDLLAGYASEAAKPRRRKRKLSAESRAKMGAAQKKRWVAAKKGKG